MSYKARSSLKLDEQAFDPQTAANWFLDLLGSVGKSGAYVYVSRRADRIYDVLEVSVVKIGTASEPVYYELGCLTPDQSESLIREYNEYRRLAN